MPELVATLVAGQGGGLSSSLAHNALALFEKNGVSGARLTWLAEDRAADIHFNGDDLPAALAGMLNDKGVDCLCQPAGQRRKKLLLADMESTIIEQEMLDELAEAVGLRDKVAAITVRAMNNELDFADALRERVALLRGLPVCALDDAARRITLMPGAEELLRTMKAAGATVWLVSGGFTCFTKPVAERLGFNRVFANELVIRDGMIAGEVVEPFLDKNSKQELLSQAIAATGIAPHEAMAVGDGANDIPMLLACNAGGGFGVAYRAKPNVRAAVPHQINHGDLRALLYAQGLNPAA